MASRQRRSVAASSAEEQAGLEPRPWAGRAVLGTRFPRASQAGGGGVGGALELLESRWVQRAPAVELRPVEVEALAVVARLGAQLL
jgi:hypothetical protein